MPRSSASASFSYSRLNQIEGELRSGALVPLLTAFAPKPTPVSLVHADRGSLPLKVRAFLDCCAPRLRERLKVGAI